MQRLRNLLFRSQHVFRFHVQNVRSRSSNIYARLQRRRGFAEESYLEGVWHDLLLPLMRLQLVAVPVTGGVLLWNHCQISPYKPLAKHEKTRLLVLEPALYKTDPLKCRLVHADSLEDYRYEAVSYAWGLETAEKTISCSGKNVSITSNLDGGLRRIRLPTEVRIIWVDALCINQDDKEETSRQVQIMREIYSKAQSVLVWLGDENYRDRDAFVWIRSLDADIQKHYKTGSESGPYTYPGSSWHVERLLERSWFRRTWVVQEVGSSSDAVVLCGNESMPWELFASLFKFLGDPTLVANQVEGGVRQQALDNITMMESARRSRYGPMAMPLFNVLLATCYMECKKPRDKIFAVLGLASDWQQQDKLLVPDYDSATTDEEIFERFAKWDCQYNRKLRILSCPSTTEIGGGGISLPTWVPNWSAIGNVNPFVRYSERTQFAASAGMSAAVWYSHDGILHAEGKEVDAIQLLGSIPKFKRATGISVINMRSVEGLEESRRWLNECQHIARFTLPIFRNDRARQLSQTITCGLTGDGFPAPPAYREYLMSYLAFLKMAPESLKSHPDYEKSLTNPYRDLEGDTESFKEEEEPIDEVHVAYGSALRHFRKHRRDNFQKFVMIESSIQQWASKRRFCGTKNGRLACVPTNAKEGDVICVLYGGEVPYVLREQDDGTYAVIGECYLNDFMHGEALSYENLRTREFSIC